MKFNMISLVAKRSVSLITKGFLLLALILPGAIWGMNAAAIAAPVQQPTLLATSASSLSKQAAGKAEKDLGTVQKNVGKVSGQVEGAAKQFSGRAKQDLGKTQSTLEDAGRKVKNRASNDANESKIAVDNTGARIGNAAENAVDNVKGFFGKS
jgi:uncharacterized protein YjbJ (UPF0337 family)